MKNKTPLQKIEELLDIAHAAYHAADDTEYGIDSATTHLPSMNALNEALDKVGEEHTVHEKLDEYRDFFRGLFKN